MAGPDPPDPASPGSWSLHRKRPINPQPSNGKIISSGRNPDLSSKKLLTGKKNSLSGSASRCLGTKVGGVPTLREISFPALQKLGDFKSSSFFYFRFMFHVYILYSPSKDRYYIGHTGVTPDVRTQRHNDGWTRSTKSGIPWKLVFSQEAPDKSTAIKWENHIKRQKSRSFIEEIVNGEKELPQW
jgi:putative endonuclease